MCLRCHSSGMGGFKAARSASELASDYKNGRDTNWVGFLFHSALGSAPVGAITEN